MEMLFRKVLASERLPAESGAYITETNLGFVIKKDYNHERKSFVHLDIHGDVKKAKKVKYWYEPVELPSEDEVELKIKEITERSFDQLSENYCFQLYNYILGFIDDKKHVHDEKD